MSESVEQPKVTLCRICQKPLEALELELERQWHFDCAKCNYCESSLPDPQRIKKCIDAEIAVSHPGCHERFIEESFKRSPVTITQAHLDHLNKARLLWDSYFNPNVDLSVETNQKETEYAFNRFGFGEETLGVAEYTLEQKFLFLQKMQALTACVSIALSNDKKKIEILRSERDRARIKEAQEYRDSTKEEKEAKSKKSFDASIDEGRKTVRKQALDAERKDPKLKLERKAVEALMNNLGMTEAEAREQVLQARQRMNPGETIQ